ncbi:tetratricopeptide repeat protein [Pseudodesulfovibrio piezophilus]|nr:tetratricopeptide repeat protein [Pseudodesulfovibrio piezophilus]
MDKKQYVEAAELIAQYRKTTRETISAEVYIAQGGALYQAQKMQQALLPFQEGLTLYPDNEYLNLNLGIVYYELKQFTEAGKLLEKTYRVQKEKKPEFLYQAGSAYYQGKKFDKSARVMTFLIKESPSPRVEWVRLAVHALLGAHRQKQAESMLITFLSVSPEESDYWKLLAKLYLDKEEYAKAAASLEIAYRQGTHSTQDLERLASIYRYQGATLMAAQTLQRAYGASPSQENALKVAALLASAGRVEQAVDYASKYSTNTTGTLAKARILFHSRRFDEAERVLGSIKESQKSPEVHFYLALCAWERGDWDHARQEFKRIAGTKQFRNQTNSYLAVLDDIVEARQSIEN